MSLRVVTMAELRLEVLLEPERTGETVAEVCRRPVISRETFYAYKRRYETEGAPGLEPRAKKPLQSPAQIDPDLEVQICKLRKYHRRWGARRIRTELRRSGVDPPALSTIHRVLRRNHPVVDQPRKRPKASKRFQRDVPNDLWQIDATKVHLEDGTEVWSWTRPVPPCRPSSRESDHRARVDMLRGVRRPRSRRLPQATFPRRRTAFAAASLSVALRLVTSERASYEVPGVRGSSAPAVDA